RRQQQVSEIRSEWETVVFVGNLRDVPGRILGRAPVLGGLGWKSLRRRDVRWTYTEVPPSPGGRSRKVVHAGPADGKGIELDFRTAAGLGHVQQLEKVIFPEHGPVVGLVAAGLIAKRDQNVAAALDSLYLALQDAELRRVDFIIGGIDG